TPQLRSWSRLRWRPPSSRSGRSRSGEETESGLVLHDAPLTAAREVARGMWVVSLEAPEVAASARAGQFVNLGLEGFLLRRPFSVYKADGDRIEVILKAVGAGTTRLLSMRPGDVVRCLGPLGHGFAFGGGGNTAALISGGLGVAPMPLAAREARAAGL